MLSRALVNVKSYEASALGAVARGLCTGEEVQALAELEYQCLHGLGHGLMITTGYNLPTSLEVCDHLQGKWNATSCNGGVFMENFFTSYGGQSPWVRDDDPVYPCNEVAEEDKQTCYQLVTSRILRVIGVDWEKTAEICASVEKNWVASCFESYGRDVAGQTHRDPEEIREVCAVARPYGGERECIRFAALDMVRTTRPGSRRRASATGTAGDAALGRAYEAVGSLMARLADDAVATSVADCRSLTTRRADDVACVHARSEGAAGRAARAVIGSRLC